VRPAFSVALFGTSVLFLIRTLALGPPARRIPLVVAVPLVLLLAVETFRELRGHEPSGRDRPAAARALAWTLALPLSIVLLGMVAGPAFYVLAYLRIRGGEGRRTAALGALVTAVAMMVVVGHLLHMSAPQGLLIAPFLR
jgi:hypothetical protein